MPAVNLSPVFRQRFFTTNGTPLAGGKVYTYQAGTSNPQATYTDNTGTAANPNPVILDASGEADIWLDQTLSYKVILTDSNDVQQYETDGIIGFLTANSVNTISIVDGAVTTAKLADGSVTTVKLADGAVTVDKAAADLLALIAASLAPPGTMSAYGGATAPTGYLLCDGASYLRTDYPALFTAIGTAYGAADGTHFNVPDARGRFLRFTDNGAGRDPEASGRTEMNPGGATGDAVGSIQDDDFESHNHPTYSIFGAAAGPNNVYTTPATAGTGFTGGAETRPINFGANLIIKT